MYNYAPFLKLKMNEIQAVYDLDSSVQNYTLPLFDIPKEKKQDIEGDILERISKGVKQLFTHTKKAPKLNFFIDNHDLDDSILLKGNNQYRYILSQLANYNVIPVMAFNRDPDHNKAALDFCSKGQNNIGIRLSVEDFQSYSLCKTHLTKAWADLNAAGVTNSYVIYDCRLIEDDARATALTAAIIKFHTKCAAEFNFTHYIVTGSVIPQNIAQLLGTKSTTMVKRLEDNIWRSLTANPITAKINYGDYGVVSPEFSEADLPLELMPKFSAPKVFYTKRGEFYVERGGQFAGHPKGYGQYFDIADNIVAKPYFRGPTESKGDKYIYDRSSLSTKLPAKGGAPGSWIKATLSSHITYAVKVR